MIFNIIEPGALLLGWTDDRTQQSAARQIQGWLEAEGWEVRLADIDPYYVHIDLMVVMLAEKLAAVCLESTEPDIVRWLEGRGVEILPVGFRDTMALGCNVVALGNDRVLLPEASTTLIEKCRALGFEVYDPDVSMITQGGGGVHCMCQQLRRDPVGVAAGSSLGVCASLIQDCVQQNIAARFQVLRCRIFGRVV